MAWKPAAVHTELLDAVLRDAGEGAAPGKLILDAGSGRTSLGYLVQRFPRANITALIHPRDERKRRGIGESLDSTGFTIRSEDLLSFRPSGPFDLVLAHLLLGEARVFGAGFAAVLSALFALPTRHLAVVDRLDDEDVDFPALLRSAATRTVRALEVRGQYVGFLLEFPTAPAIPRAPARAALPPSSTDPAPRSPAT